MQRPPPPYYAYLVFNLALHAKPKSQIEVHTSPEAVIFLRNALRPPSTDCWALVAKIGPFPTREAAERLASVWSERTRRNVCLVAKGLFLAEHWPLSGQTTRVHRTPCEEPVAEAEARLRGRFSIYEHTQRPMMRYQQPHAHPSPSLLSLHDIWRDWLPARVFLNPMELAQE